MKMSSAPFKSMATALAVASAFAAQPAAAATSYTYSFSCLSTTSAANCADGENHLVMEVSDAGVSGSGAHQVDFTFTNLSALGSSLTEVYFDDGTLLGISSLSDSGAGVNFTTQKINPGNLPDANLATPAFVTTAGFAADTLRNTSDGVQNLADTGGQEFLTIRFSLKNSYTFDDTILALNGVLTHTTSGGDPYPALRVGLHARSYADGLSASFINNVTPVPEADTWATMLAGLGLVGFMARRRRII